MEFNPREPWMMPLQMQAMYPPKVPKSCVLEEK